VEQVLRHCYELPDGTDYYAGLLIDQLYCPWDVTQTVPVMSKITTAEHIKAWQKQDERTSSEPTGLSFNHYKVAAQDPEETPATDHTDNPRLDEASTPQPKRRHPTPERPAKHKHRNPERDLIATTPATMTERQCKRGEENAGKKETLPPLQVATETKIRQGDRRRKKKK
jgi:hypothetical protein